jgi:hypothetical protein
MTRRGQRQPTAYLLSPLHSSNLQELGLPHSPSSTSGTLFIHSASSNRDAEPVFSAAC